MEHRRLHCSSHRLGKKERGGKKLLRSKLNRSLACIDSCSTVREKRAVSTQKQQFFLDRMEDKGRREGESTFNHCTEGKSERGLFYSFTVFMKKGTSCDGKQWNIGAGNVF